MVECDRTDGTIGKKFTCFGLVGQKPGDLSIFLNEIFMPALCYYMQDLTVTTWNLRLLAPVD